MFCHFWQKFENSKWLPFLGRGKFFGKLQRLHSLDTLWVENFDEIALSRTVKEIEANVRWHLGAIGLISVSLLSSFSIHQKFAYTALIGQDWTAGDLSELPYLFCHFNIRKQRGHTYRTLC